MSEVVTFIPDAGGSIVINGKCFFIKISLISGISDTKIGLKSGNLFTDFLQYTGNFKRYLMWACRTLTEYLISMSRWTATL